MDKTDYSAIRESLSHYYSMVGTIHDENGWAKGRVEEFMYDIINQLMTDVEMLQTEVIKLKGEAE